MSNPFVKAIVGQLSETLKSWGIAYARVAKDADSNDGSEVNTGILLQEGYEYAFGLKLISHGTADYSDPSHTVKILQILPGLAITITPTVGGGEGEADGGVPNRILFEAVPATEENGRELAFITGCPRTLVPGVGSVVHGAFDFIEDYTVVYGAGEASYLSVKGDGTILAYFGDHGNQGGLDRVYFVARRKLS